MSEPENNCTSPARWLWIASSVWAVVNLLPYAVAGETWGMMWFPLNQPLSSWLKDSPATDLGYPHLFILITTVINALAIGLLVAGCLRVATKFRRSK